MRLVRAPSLRLLFVWTLSLGAACAVGSGEWPPPLGLAGQANISLDSLGEYDLGQVLTLQVGADQAGNAIRYSDDLLQAFFAELADAGYRGGLPVQVGAPVLHGVVAADGSFTVSEVIDLSDAYSAYQLYYEVTGEAEWSSGQVVGLSAERTEVISDSFRSVSTGLTFDLGTLSGERRCAGRDVEPDDDAAHASDLGTLTPDAPLDVAGCLFAVGQNRATVMGDLDLYRVRVTDPSTLHVSGEWWEQLPPAVYTLDIALADRPAEILEQAYGEPPIRLDYELQPDVDYLVAIYGYYGHAGPYALTFAVEPRYAACATDPALCDDGNQCTDDVCEPFTGCTNAARTGACEDGDLCTLGDACNAGVCVPGPPRECQDGDPCTLDSCVPATGACVQQPNPECPAS